MIVYDPAKATSLSFVGWQPASGLASHRLPRFCNRNPTSNTRRVQFCKPMRRYPLSIPKTPVMIASKELETNQQVPSSICDANTTIVGGGPTGLLAAILLADRGVSVTVVEQEDCSTFFNPSRTYAIGVNTRGRVALEQIPGLLEHVMKGGVPVRAQRIRMTYPDGSFRNMMINSQKKGSGVFIYTSRIGLVEQLRAFAARFKNINFMHGSKVTDVIYHNEGEIELRVDANGEGQHIRSKLVLACDGKNSILSETLARTRDHEECELRSSYGLGKESRSTSSTGLLVKSIVFKENYLPTISVEEKQSADTGITCRLWGETEGREANETFWVTGFPFNEDIKLRCKGHLVTMVQAEDHKVWKVKSVEDGFKLFQENFPQLEVRSAISKESMKTFIEAKPLRLPTVTRVKSLVVHVGTGQSAGLVFLGDAAHSFPPDIGQGVNAAFEDASVFMQVLTEAGATDSIQSVLEDYETEREEDVQGLMELVLRSALLGKMKSLKSTLSFLERGVRGNLSQMFPRMFYPSTAEMAASNYRYKDLLALDRLTRTRLAILGVSITMTPVLGLALTHVLNGH